MQAFFDLIVSAVQRADVSLWFRILFELFDFMVKAAAAYRLTEEGAKEWDDFATRYEVAVNNGANDNVSYSVRSQAAPQKSSADQPQYDNPNGGRS
jgi:hypothetical protein